MGHPFIDRAVKNVGVRSLLSEAERFVTPPPTAKSASEALARIAGGDTSTPPVLVAPVDAIAPWYENVPGGMSGAIARSKRSLRTTGLPEGYERGGLAYGNRLDLSTPVPVEPLVDGRATRWGSYDGDAARVSPETFASTAEGGYKGTPESVLEHELTHAATIGPLSFIGNSSIDELNAEGFHPDAIQIADRNAPSDFYGHIQYAMGRAETDPRAAEIRRRYAWATGKDVSNPDEAQEALSWYLKEGLKSPAFGPFSMRRPTTIPLLYRLIDEMPDDVKKPFLIRMSQVPAVAAPIAIGAGASEDRSVLDGLSR